MSEQASPSLNKQIAALALPSLATLLVEPLLVAVDATMVGNLGTAQLAGLSLSSTILNTVVGICIFLAYATTAATARLVGAADRAGAYRKGVDGIWLALALGLVLGTLLSIFATPVISIFGPTAAVAQQATAYARASALGLPGMLVVLAATGALRGFANTKLPLYAATSGALLNIPLNFTLIYGLKMGVAGAGLGTAIAQTAMAAILCAAFFRQAHHGGVSLWPTGSGVLRSLSQAGPLIVRTLSLRAAILLQIAAATALGTTALASNQIVMSMWNFAAYGLDALATAAQILVGQALGRKDAAEVHLVLRRCMQVTARVGIALALAFAALGFLVPILMSRDPAVQGLATQSMFVAALAIPIAAQAYLLDGALIGAGDTRALAKFMVLALALFSPFAVTVLMWGREWGTVGMLFLWLGYAVVFMTVRAATMYWRSNHTDWMHLES